MTLGQRGQPLTPPSSRSRWLGAMLKVFFALQHCLCAALRLCLRRGKAGDEMPFALALTVELTWLSPQQRCELQALGAPNPTVDPLWPANVIDFSSYYPDRALRRRLAASPTPAAPAPTRWHWATALAVATGFVAISPLLLYWPSAGSNEYVTGTGEHRSILLADGSTVTMNTQSRLRVRYSSRGRDVELVEGEALFSVAREANRPFRVHALQTIVEAVGTEFSVYLGKSAAQVVVTQGRVKMSASPPPGPIILNPSGLAWTDETLLGFERHATEVAVGAGHEARVSRASDTLPGFEVDSRSLSPEQLERRIAWTNGQLAFAGERLDEVVEQFNRYNWRKLRIADPQLADIRVGGWFRSTHVDEFVGVLRHLFGIRAVPVVDPRSHEQTLQLLSKDEH